MKERFIAVACAYFLMAGIAVAAYGIAALGRMLDGRRRRKPAVFIAPTLARAVAIPTAYRRGWSRR